MNTRTTKQLIEIFISSIVSIALFYLGNVVLKDHLGGKIAMDILSIFPIIWLSLRHGFASGIISAAIAGGVSMVIGNQSFNLINGVISILVPLLSGAVAGFFAKYTQKTLNNRRLKSTNLNIVTATIVSGIMFVGFKYFVSPIIVTEMSSGMNFTISQWGVIVGVIALIACIIMMLAKINPRLLIPKRTKYLSRRETSSLLND